MVNLTIVNRWRLSEASLRIRWAAHLDQVETAKRIESSCACRDIRSGSRSSIEASPCANRTSRESRAIPTSRSSSARRKLSLYFVAQRERGALSAVSVHEIHPRCRARFLGRAMDNSGPGHVSQNRRPEGPVMRFGTLHRPLAIMLLVLGAIALPRQPLDAREQPGLRACYGVVSFGDESDGLRLMQVVTRGQRLPFYQNRTEKSVIARPRWIAVSSNPSWCRATFFWLGLRWRISSAPISSRRTCAA